MLSAFHTCIYFCVPPHFCTYLLLYLYSCARCDTCIRSVSVYTCTHTHTHLDLSPSTRSVVLLLLFFFTGTHSAGYCVCMQARACTHIMFVVFTLSRMHIVTFTHTRTCTPARLPSLLLRMHATSIVPCARAAFHCHFALATRL